MTVSRAGQYIWLALSIALWGFGIGIPSAALRLIVVVFAVSSWAEWSRAYGPRRQPSAVIWWASGLWTVQAFVPLLPVPVVLAAIFGWQAVRSGRTTAGSRERVADSPGRIVATLGLSVAAVAGTLWWLADRSGWLWIDLPIPATDSTAGLMVA